MDFEYAALTHCGRRKNNEDNLCAEPALGLYAVADGMGGYEGGEVASQIAVATLAEFLPAGSDNRRCGKMSQLKSTDDSTTLPVSERARVAARAASAYSR